MILIVLNTNGIDVSFLQYIFIIYFIYYTYYLLTNILFCKYLSYCKLIYNTINYTSLHIYHIDNKVIILYTYLKYVNMNMNMNGGYYFKFYAELHYVNSKSLPCVKYCTRWRLSGGLIYKITW